MLQSTDHPATAGTERSRKRCRRRPHLLYLVTEDWYFVSHRLGLAKAALERGYRVTVATRTGDKAGEIRAAGIDLAPLAFRRSGLNPLHEAGFFGRLVELYRDLKPDIVHHVAMKPVVYGSYAAALTHRPAVVNALGGLGFLFSSDSAKASALRHMVAPVLARALKGSRRMLILQNEDDRDLFIRRRFIRPEAIRLINGVGIDPRQFPHRSKPPAPCLVVLPARLLRAKGVAEFVAAARILKGRGVAARFALVGRPDPDNPGSIGAAQIEAWARDGAVEAWGWRDDMTDVYAQAHIVCLPSYYREGIPKTLLEGAAASCALVTTDMPGCREVVRHEQDGLLVPPRDPVALADALGRLIADDPLRQRFASNARARVLAEFTAQSAINATLDLYDAVLRQ